MIIALIVVASLAVYLAAGFVIASRRRSLMWAQARHDWCIEEYAVGQVKARFVGVLLFWPVCLPGIVISGALARYTAEGDPRERERALAARERHIQQMERELGIGGKS